jgi:hypothetical protein
VALSIQSFERRIMFGTESSSHQISKKTSGPRAEVEPLQNGYGSGHQKGQEKKEKEITGSHGQAPDNTRDGSSLGCSALHHLPVDASGVYSARKAGEMRPV